MDKIIFFHMNQLGDLLFSLPLLKTAKEESGAKIVSVVKPSLAPLLTSSGLADEIIPKEHSVFKLMKNLKKDSAGSEAGSIAVLFSESPSSLLAAYFSGLKERIGFDSASLSFLLTKRAKKKGVPSLFNNKELGISAGFKNVKSDYTDILNIPEESINNVREWFLKNNFNPVNTIAVSTGASKKRQDKRLPVSVWVDTINSLYDLGYNCVLTGAPWEKDVLNEIAQKCAVKPVLFTADNGILESAAFFSFCSLFIGIDSGAMHLAAALKRKCIGIFVKTDPEQIGPMPLENHIIIRKSNAAEVSSAEIVEEAVKYYDSIYEKYKHDITFPVQNPSLIGLMRKAEQYPTEENRDKVLGILKKSSFLAPGYFYPEKAKKENNGSNSFTVTEDMTINFHTISNNSNERFLPAFTDWWEKGKFNCDKKAEGIIVTFDDLSGMVLKDENLKGFVINPFGENFAFDRNFIMFLQKQSGAKVVPVEVKEDTEVLVGKPGIYPHDMVNAVIARVRNISEVRKVYLQLMMRDNIKSYLMIVDFDGEKNKVFQSIANAAVPFLKDMHIDIVEYSSDFAQRIVHKIEPFYKK